MFCKRCKFSHTFIFISSFLGCLSLIKQRINGKQQIYMKVTVRLENLRQKNLKISRKFMEIALFVHISILIRVA